MVTNLTEGYAVVTGVVGGVQLHGSSGLRSEVVAIAHARQAGEDVAEDKNRIRGASAVREPLAKFWPLNVVWDDGCMISFFDP